MKAEPQAVLVPVQAAPKARVSPVALLFHDPNTGADAHAEAALTDESVLFELPQFESKKTAAIAMMILKAFTLFSFIKFVLRQSNTTY